MTATTLGLGFLGLMALLAIVRGVLRLFRAMITLGLAFAAGTLVFIKGPDLLKGVVETPSGHLLAGMSFIAGGIAHLGSGFALNKLLGGLDAAQLAGENVSKLKAAALSLLPSGFFLWAGGILVRLTGSASGLAHADAAQGGTEPWLAQLRDSISSGVMGRLFNATDPFTTDSATRLCQVLVDYRVHDRVDQLARDPRYRSLFADPRFRRLINDREVKHAVAFRDFTRLLTLSEVREAAADPALAKILAALPEPEVRRAEKVL